MSKIRIVLVNPSHPGNIGAAARAMKNMGLSELYLVNPKEFPHHEATARAAGADDILANSRTVSSLPEAFSGCEIIFATSARTRRLEWPLCTPREAAQKIASMPADSKVAIVFGRENNGLSNEELALSQYHICIPTAEDFSSLNLAAAVQLIAYELFVAHKSAENFHKNTEELDELATFDEVEGFLDNFRNLMIKINFLNPAHPKMLMQRIRKFFTRAQMTKTEINIFRGVITGIEKYFK